KTVGIRAVAVDAPSPAVLADLPPAKNIWQRLMMYPLQRFYLHVVGWFSKQPPLPANRSILAKIAPRPIFFISTGRKMEQRMVHQFFEAAAGPKALWEIPEAHHAGGWQVYPDRYDHNLIHFFDGALVSTRDQEVEPAVFEPVRSVITAIDEETVYPVVGAATISLIWANVVALLLLPVAYLLLFVPYRWVWGVGVLERVISLNLLTLVGVVLVFGASIVVHEWIHAVAFVRIGGVAETAVRYGFSWKGMAPYAHCKAPMRAAAYRWAVLLPGLLLGVLPAVVGLAAGIWWLVMWGALMVVMAGGDTAVLIAMRHVPADALVLDHPKQAGCLIIDENNSK
ncbi:MAG: DUF3267 domain-containing protein, partial [Anaerolineales bacterium]|nr:DUF3267 domain-containing protein [Anaerolineales bacterium]